jgi:hypothetical protein
MALMRRIAGLLAAAALGCGSGSTSAGNSFSGTVHGQGMKPADAVSSNAAVSLGSISANVLSIVLIDSAGTCAKVSANSEPKSAKALIILLADFNAFVITPPAGTGTFTVYDPRSAGLPPAHVAVATFAVSDASCNEVPAQSAIATSGSVKLNSGSAGSYTGTFTIGFDSGDQVSGEFHTADCPGLGTYLGNATHSCG